MTLPIFPNAISINDLRTEFGVTGTRSLSDFYSGGSIVGAGTVGFPTGGAGVTIPSGGTISLNNFHGASSLFFITITGTFSNFNLNSYLLANGWNGSSNLLIYLGVPPSISNPGSETNDFVAYAVDPSTSNKTPGMVVNFSGASPSAIIFNWGIIMGQGGNGGSNPSTPPQAGGTALVLNDPNVTFYNQGYIMGGGGGGGGSWDRSDYWVGGGGGAGGGDGGSANDSGFGVTSGGVGGAIFQQGGSSSNRRGGSLYGGAALMNAGGVGGPNEYDGGEDDNWSGGGGGRVVTGPYKFLWSQGYQEGPAGNNPSAGGFGGGLYNDNITMFAGGEGDEDYPGKPLDEVYPSAYSPPIYVRNQSYIAGGGGGGFGKSGGRGNYYFNNSNGTLAHNGAAGGAGVLKRNANTFINNAVVWGNISSQEGLW